MRKNVFFFYLMQLSLFATASDAALAADGDLPKHEGRTVDGFHAVVLLTRDLDSFLEQWRQPARPGYAPQLSTVDSAVAGEMIDGVVLFDSCQTDDAGSCHVGLTLSLKAPARDEFSVFPEQMQWSGPPVPEPNMMLGNAPFGISWDEEEGLGLFQIVARVCDKVAEDCLEIDASLESQSSAEAVRDKRFLDSYYIDQRPILIGPWLDMVKDKKVLHDPNSVPPLLGFLAAVLSQNPDMKESLRPSSNEPDPIFDQTWKGAVAISQNPLAEILSRPVSTSTNDMLWGAYFATGEVQYLEPLVARLEHLDERRDLALFLAAATAKWSLLSNAKQHERVRAQLAKMATDPLHREQLDALIADPGQDVREWMKKVVMEQREKGVW